MPTTMWNEFVDQVERELQGEGTYFPLSEPFTDERDLTRAIGQRIRKLFGDRLPIADTFGIQDHVTYRNGVEPGDAEAWTAAQRDKWVTLHGLNFVPDVLLRRTLKRVTVTAGAGVRTFIVGDTDTLPIEIKFVDKPDCSQAVATAVGQCLAYTTRYGHAVLFVGVTRGLVNGQSGLHLSSEAGAEATFRDTLKQNGITLILREVG